MKTHLSPALLLTVWILCTSCGEEDGACEIKRQYTNVPTEYLCYNSYESERCEKLDGGQTEIVWHEGKTCSSLGYSYDESSIGFIYAEGDAYTPGPYGAFKDEKPDNTGNCTDEYEGPLFDIQIDSQCQAAYAYACAGAQEGVDAACAIYKSYQSADSSIPDCPYCN